MSNKGRTLHERVGVASFGVFVLWVGFCFLTQIGWGVGLLGVAVITLGTQVVRAMLKLAVEGFWVAAGVVFAASGAWHLLHIEVDFGPVLLMAVGLLLFLGAFFGKSRQQEQ